MNSIGAKPAAPVPETNLVEAAAGLFQAGMKFLQSLTPQTLSSLVRTDSNTNRSTLAIPLPESFTAERLASAVSVLLGK